MERQQDNVLIKNLKLFRGIDFPRNFFCDVMIGRSGFAVGLSAISFSASLQKDVASIPNAFAAANSMLHTIPKNPNPKIEETCQCVFIFNETLTRLYNNSKLIRRCLILYLFRPFRAANSQRSISNSLCKKNFSLLSFVFKLLLLLPSHKELLRTMRYEE